MKTYKVIFTVFTVMILGAFVVTSCSDDEEGIVPNQLNKREVNPSLGDLKLEWEIISSSVEYLEFLSSVDSFGSKLPQEAALYLGDRETMLSWIEANVSLTGFNSFNEAESELIAIEERYLNIMVINEGFFRDVSLIDNPYQNTDIFTPFPFQPETPVANGECEYNCINDAVDCGRAVDATYRDRMAAAQMLIRMGLFPAAAALTAAATIAQHVGQRACVNAMWDCYEEC